MSNPFEKYFQATERQHDKINRMTPNWEVPASSPFVPFDTSLDARYSELNKPYTPDPTLKSAGDLLVDAAASALKIPTIVGGVAVGAADLALSAASKPFEWAMDAGHAVRPDLIPEPMNVGIGYIAKGLHDTIGYRPEEAKAFIDEKLFSDARKIQEKEYQSGYTAAEDKAFQDSWVSKYQAQVANLQKAGATEQQLKDFNTGFDKQYQEAATQRADKYQTSWDKSLSENVDIIGHGFNNLLENPSLALGGAIESAGYLLPSMAVSRGVMALEKAANVAKIGRVAAAEMAGKSIGELAITRSPFLAAGIGEGSVSGLTVLEQMRSQMPDGIAGGRELLGALGVAASTGLIGGVSGKLGSHVGLDDVDAIAAGRLAAGTAAMKLPALVKPVAAIAHEGGEEFAQTFGESIIPNVTMGKDPLEGLGQELPLGTMAGAIMGAGMNAPSLVSGGFSDISSGLGKVKEAVSDAASLKSFETLSNPEHKNYNPAQAFNSQVKNLESNDETVRTQAQASVAKLTTDLDTARAKTADQISNIEAALKAMPPVPQMTDAQHLEVAALRKEYDNLQAKSEKLTEHLIGFLDAQVMAQENRDAKQGTQFTEEQAKADIATLTQPQTSTAVWSTAGGDVPVEVTGEAYTDDVGNVYLPVKYELQGEMVNASVPVKEVTSQPSPTDTTAQQEALDRVTRHFSKYSNDDLDLLATSPILSEEQRNSLRLMSESKRELAAVQDPSQVFNNILNGYKGKTIQESHRGLNQYTDMVNTALATKNEQLAQLALDGLGAFTDDHTAKRDTINEAFGLVQKGTYAEVHALRTQEGTWGLVPFTAQEVKAGKNAAGANYLSKAELNKVGGFNVHINSDKNGAITQINNETQLIRDRFDALSGVAESFVGVTPKPVDTSTAPTIDTPVVTESSQRSPKLEEAYKETFSKPIENWDANDFASVGAQATHIGSTFDSKTIDADNAFSQKMAKKIIANGIAKNRSTADIMQDVMFVAYSSDFAMRRSGVDALHAYIELRKAQGTSTTPIVTEPSDTTPPVVTPAPEAPVQSGAPVTPKGFTDTLDTDDVYKTWSNLQDGSDRVAMREQMDYVAKTYGSKVTDVNRAQVTQELSKQYKWFRSATPEQQSAALDSLKAVDTITAPTSSGFPFVQVGANKDHWVNQNAIVDRTIADRKGLTGTIEEMFAKGIRAKDVAFKLKDTLTKAGIAHIDHEGFVVNVRATLGIPSRASKEGQDEFDQWLRERNARINPTPATPAIPTETKAPVNVWAGSNENAGLSNLATRPFTFGTKKYQSVEHAYQTLKSGSFDQQTYDKYAGTENKKIAGNRGTKTTDNANVRLMEKLMTASFEQNKDAMELLQKTGDAAITHTQDKSIWGKEFPRILMEIRESNKAEAPTPSQDTSVVTEGDKQAPKIGETATEVKGRFTITKTVVSDNTVLSVHTNNEDGEVTKSEYATTYPDIYSDELGGKYTIVIYRDSANPSVITDVKSFDAKDINNTSGSYGEQGTQTDEQYVTTLTEAGDVTLEYTDKFEKSLPVIKPKTPTTATPTDTVSIDKLEATVKSFVKVRDITSEEYIQDTATVYEKQWFKVKTAYNNTVRRLVELVSKGVTTVEDVAALTDILNKLYEFAAQTIDLNSDRAASDKLIQRINSLATVLFSDVSPEIIDAYLKQKTESIERRGSKLTTDRDGAKSFDGRTIEYVFNAPHLQETKTTAPVEVTTAQSKEKVKSNETSSTNSPNDSAGEAANTGSQEVNPLKPEFQGKVILAHAGTGKSFATKSNPDLIDGDVLYYQATNTIVDKYNKQNGETVPNIKDVTGTKGVFTAWGEYDKSNPERQAEAVRRRDEVYAEYAKQARALADAGKTVLSSSIRKELIAVADMVVIQDDAAFIGKNLTSAERVNQNSETDLVKIQGKIDKAKNAASKNPNLKTYTLEKGEYISDLIFEEPAAPKDAKVTVLQGVTDEVAAAERKKPFNLRNILKGYFTQSSTKEGAVGANPLVTVKDFLKGLGTLTQVSDWLNDRRKPTQKQLDQVEHFKEFHAEFAKALKFVFNTQASAIFVSNKENLVGYLEMGKKPSTRELDENVVTALALSAYSYLIKQGNKVMNTNEELETLFRLKKGVRAPLEIEQMFRFAGQEMPIVVKALGTDTAKALGLKVREDQDPTLQDRLNTALGILAMEAMAKAGFIVIDTLEGKPLTDFLTAIKTVRESKAHTSEDEYDFEVDTDAETQIKKFTMVRPNAKMEGIGNSVFEKGIIETEVDGKIVRTETPTLNRPVLTKGLPTLNSSLVNELIEANKDTKGFLSYLFGVDVGLTTPLKEIPKKFSQRLINGTDASVPSVQAELLTEAQKHSFTMRTNTVAVFAAMQKLGENNQFLKEVLGIWVDDHVLSRTHVTERDSLQAKAQNDWAAVLNGLEWADATLDENGQYQEFYDTQFVAQNQRQHLNSNLFNMQTSQIHRAMAALTGFSTTIDLSQDEQGTVKDEALLNLFYQAVGEGLEGLDDYLKADILAKAEAGLHQFFTVDKVYGDYYVPALKAFLETTESKNAIEAMRALIETGTINTDQQEAIAAFVSKGKMGAQSLQSLIALAELSIAQANGTTFTTTIGFGSDGVNHGVSAANMLTGVISKDMRQQTGIFPIAEKGQDQISNMQEVYRRKITDYYVDFGKVMSRKLRDLVGTLRGKLNTDFVQGMTALFPKFEVLDDTGELRDLLAMRKIAKIWAIPFNYSAGKAALQRALARGFLAGIYGSMNKLANEALDIIDAGRKEGTTEEEKATLRLKLETVKLKTKTLEDNLNKVLSKYGMSVTLPAPQLLNEEAQGKLSTELENTLMQAAIELHGEAAWQATAEFAKDYLEVRNVYTEVEKASFTLFDVVRNQLIEEKKANRKFTNTAAKVQVKGKTVQYTAEELNAQEAEYFGLTTVETAEVDAALAAMRPMFNTALSIGSESTNDAGSVTNPSGVSVRKHKIQREPAKGLRAVNTYYLKEIDAKGKPFSESRNIGLTKEVEENAGVASSANAIQSIDAFVAAKVQGFMDALNVHDAAIFGLKNFLKGVKKQNEEHLRALTNYQLGLEHAKMLVRVYVGYEAFMATQEEALKSEDVMVRENAQKLITKTKKQMEVLLWGEQMFKGDTALIINNQLVYKGGLIPKLQAAKLDIKDNAGIEEAISVFINFALKQDLQKLEVLLDTYSIHQFAGEGGMHQLTKADKASIEKQKALVQKALSDLGTELTDKAAPMNTTEAVKPTTKLAEFLRKAKGAVIDITSLIEHLTNNTDIADPKARAAQLEVLKAITPLIDKATKVVYSEGAYDGYGYYDEETNTLHINSAKEAEGGVRSTLAVHELLHAALSRRIKTLRTAIKNNSGEHPEAVAALKRLDALRINLVTPAGMKMLELRAELGSAIEDSVKFYTDQDALIASLKEQVATSLGELQQFNKDKAKPDVLAAKAKEWNSLKTELANAQATLAKADQYLKLRKLLKAKVLSQHTRKDGSISKFTQLDLVNQLENTDEFISHGLTESRLRQVLSKKTVVAAFRSFVKLVGQLLGFSSNQVNALEAFASDTAALLETIGSVTPVVAPNNGERLFSTQSAEDLVNGQSSLDIMQALPHSNTGAFNQQLDRLITEEIGQLYNQDDAAKARIDEIQTLTASDALNAGFTLSRKEQYVQQALQYAVAAYMKLHAGGANVGQLRRVYHAAKVKISPTGKDFHEGDWATATQQEKDIAKAKYDFLFDSTKEGYMDRFVSMALASESVSKILDIALPLTKPETQDKTWFEKVNDWVSYVMAWLNNKYVRLNPTLGASNQLSQLMDNLVKLDIRNRQEGVAFHQKAWNTVGLVTTPLNKALKGAGGALLSGVGLRDSRFLPVRALGAILVLRSEEAAKAIPKMIIDMRNNQLPNTKLGEVANILLEASGVGTLRDKFDVLIRQTNLNAKNRQDIVDNVKKAVNTWFKAPLTKAQHAAVAYGLLGTDAQALLENYSVEDIVNMALHEGKLNAEIAKLKKEIAKNPNGNDMLNAAEQLGYYMVTRIGGEGLVKNALGIAIGLGTQYFTSVEQADPKLVSQLNTLVSMLAMTHVPNSDKAILAALYKTDAEGVHAVIQLHQGLVNDSLKDFQANPLNMVKGWMPEVTNPYLEIKAANSMVERQQMEAEGWVLIDELKRDKHDKGSPKYLMKHNDIGYQRLVSGAVDLGSTARSGTEAISRTSPKYLGITQARYQNAARRAAIPNSSFDPSKQPRGLIAAYDTNGMALAYNYEMDNETRDAHLDRKHNIGDLLGTFGGLNYYKPEKAKQSNTVAEVLFEDYKANYSQNPNAYLKISPKSTDPKVVEMWRMLPQDFRQRATELYGKGNPIIIRNEAFNLAFGFKKFSVVSYAFDAVKAERERIAKGLVGTGKAPNAFQSGFVRLAEATRKGTAQADFAKAEHVVQEIVKAIKDFIVIRSGTTMMWNIFANVLMLMANGINPVTIIKDWVFAVTNVRAYQKLNSQLIQAQADLAGGKDPVALKQRIGALKAELKANVMNPYINAGLLSSIVEDVNIQQGEYTYASAFKQTVDEKTQWIPKPVKTAAAVLTIAPSTKLYQFLATTTQLSDFVAKYSMSKHLQANGTDIDASIIEASKTFINYDVPTSQGLQYANDMGLFMFTKFFLRIQAVLMKLLGKRAGSTIAQHILVESLTGAEGILSPIAYGHIGNNPIESSVFGLPSAFFSIGTVDAVTDVGTPF